MNTKSEAILGYLRKAIDDMGCEWSRNCYITKNGGCALTLSLAGKLEKLETAKKLVFEVNGDDLYDLFAEELGITAMQVRGISLANFDGVEAVEEYISTLE